MPKANTQRLPTWVCLYYDLLMILLTKCERKIDNGLGGSYGGGNRRPLDGNCALLTDAEGTSVRVIG